jgi:parallel beta-helix repeat protein
MENTVYNSDTGIDLTSPDLYYSRVIKNTVYNCTNDGISLQWWVDNSTVMGNVIYDCNRGIYSYYNHNNTMIDNTIYNCSHGIYLDNSESHIIEGNTIYDMSGAGIYLTSSSSFNMIKENVVYDALQDGIFLVGGCDNNSIISNTIYNCSNFAQTGGGIGLHEGSDNNSITDNSIYNSPDNGITISDSSDNTISYNNIFNNTEYGLIFVSSGTENNTVTMNNFVDNNVGYPAYQSYFSQALDDGTLNIIDSNYWSDWSGTGDYIIDITTNTIYPANNDSNPLMGSILPSISVVTPIDQEYETDDIPVMLSGSATVVQYEYYIAGFDSINQTWTERVNRTLPDGTYTLHAFASDAMGNTVSESVTFTVDAYLPTVTITSPTNTTYDHTDVPLTYTAENGVVTIYLNGMANTTAVPSGSVVSDFPDAPSIPDGVYNITIVVIDEAGNIAKATIIFTIDAVEDTTPTTTTPTTTTDTTTTTSQPGSFPSLISILVFFTAFIVYFRRKKKT